MLLLCDNVTSKSFCENVTMDEVTLTMSKKDRTRLYAIKLLIDGKSTVKETAEALSLSERQVKRLKAGVKEYGDAFVLHKNKGKKPVHATDDEIKKRVIALARERYGGANFTHMSELLAEHEGIVLSRPTVARICMAAGIKSPRKHKPAKGHRSRARKAQMGLLVQIDASSFAWIKDAAWSLHGAIDDATGAVLSLVFYPTECLNGYFSLMREAITKHGVPIAIYADRHTIFQSPKNTKRTIEDELLGLPAAYTQFSRACSELGISLIPAYSPQAKGRVERLWQTLQDRLFIEMRLAGIKTLEEANLFLGTFICHFNARFAKAPLIQETAFRECAVDLDTILVRKIARKTDNGSTVTFERVKYQLIDKNGVVYVKPRSIVTLFVDTKKPVRAECGGILYGVARCPAIEKHPVRQSEASKAHTPSAEHPWKKGLPRIPKGMHDTKTRHVLYHSSINTQNY
jgi:hypothetical protein